MAQTKTARISRPEPVTKLYEFTIHFVDSREKPISFRAVKYPNDAGEATAETIINSGYKCEREDGSREYFPARAIRGVSVREVEADSAV